MNGHDQFQQGLRGDLLALQAGNFLEDADAAAAAAADAQKRKEVRAEMVALSIEIYKAAIAISE